MHTDQAINVLATRARLYLPPLPRGSNLRGFLTDMNIGQRIDLLPAAGLHRGWLRCPFVLQYRSELRAAVAVYGSARKLRFALAWIGTHHVLKVHDTEHVWRKGLLMRPVTLAAAGRIGAFTTMSRAGREGTIS